MKVLLLGSIAQQSIDVTGSSAFFTVAKTKKALSEQWIFYFLKKKKEADEPVQFMDCSDLCRVIFIILGKPLL
jgi:hypothetical protein